MQLCYLLIVHAKDTASICNTLISDSFGIAHMRACKEMMETYILQSFLSFWKKPIDLRIKYQNNNTILRLSGLHYKTVGTCKQWKLW